MKRERCKYCPRRIPKGGAMQIHLRFKHRREYFHEIMSEFRSNPAVQVAMIELGSAQRLLLEHNDP
jgi:hypothetical protein